MTPPVHPQPSIYETTVGARAVTHSDVERIALDVPWTLEAANARVTQAMRSEGWFERDGVMVAPAKPRRTRKAVGR